MATFEDNELIININNDSSGRKPFVKRHKKEQNHELKKIEHGESIKKDITAKEKDINKKKSHIKLQQQSIKHKPISSLFKNNPELPVIKLNEKSNKQDPLFSRADFSSLELHPHLVACLRDRLHVTEMTTVQQKAIPKILECCDVLIKSSTGSGKTLAYATPIVQMLQAQQPKLERKDGVHALVILPTRELAIQSYECFVQLCRAFTWIVPGCLIGGEKKKSEKARIRKGITILVTTPGRLIDHLQHTTNLSLQFVKWLIIDEADRLLELGFKETIANIVTQVQDCSLTERQTVLLSATLTNEVQSVAGLAMKNPVMIDITQKSNVLLNNSDTEFTVPSKLTQYILFVPVKLRLLTLSCFLIDQCSRGKLKALIFMSAQNVVDFHYLIFSEILRDLLRESDLKLDFFKLHGNMKQQDRTQIFNEYRKTNNGVLICTDVAARGLDLPNVDWIIQYSCPSSVEDYIHRIGRTARIGTKGNSVIFLHPSESQFLEMLQKHKISLSQMVLDEILPASKLLLAAIQGKRKRNPVTTEEFGTALQDIYEQAILSNNLMVESARNACVAYVRSYASYPKAVKELLPFNTLHLGHLAKSFCLRETPSEISYNMFHQSNRHSFTKEAYSQKELKSPSNIRNRKRPSEVSEFSSGLNEINFKKKKK